MSKHPTRAPRSRIFKSMYSQTLWGGALESFPQWKGNEVALVWVKSQVINHSFMFPSHMYVYEYVWIQTGFNWFVLWNVPLASSPPESFLQQSPSIHPSPPVYLGHIFQTSWFFSCSLLDCVPFFPPNTFCKCQSLLCSFPSESSATLCRREALLSLSTYTPNNSPWF